MRKDVTEVGRFLRKLRIDANEVLYDMAKKIGCSSSFISALELGKRPVPTDFQQKIAIAYGLTPEQQSALQQAIDQSANSVTIDFNDLNADTRELALVFARRLKTMEEKEAEKMLEFLNTSNSGEKPK